MQTYRALLIGNGEQLAPRVLQSLAKQADYILAADGGADKALACGVMPNGVIGDLDSLSPRTQKLLKDRILHVPTQENTDLEKAILWLKKHHFTHVTLAGFVGDRWDFTGFGALCAHVGNLCGRQPLVHNTFGAHRRVYV